MALQSRVVKGEVVKKWSRFCLETIEKSNKDTSSGAGIQKCGRKISHRIQELKQISILHGQPLLLEQEGSGNKEEAENTRDSTDDRPWVLGVTMERVGAEGKAGDLSQTQEVYRAIWGWESGRE